MPIRAKRILWPTDFSELALRACKYAKAFRDLFGSELHVLHVIALPLPMDVALAMPAETPISVPEPELREAAHEGLERIIDEQFNGDSDVKREVLFGTAWSGVCEYAQREEIELIVVSTHGRTGLQHVLIGSTAERIVQHAPCPVLVIKDEQRDFVTD